MNKFLFPSFLLLVVFTFSGFSQTIISEDFATVSWNDHFEERNAAGDIGPGDLLIASESSDIRVARLNYVGDKIADIYYPIDHEPGDLRGAVIFVSGDTDSHIMNWYGRTLKDTNQYLQWGQVIAEAGMIAITYELQNPQIALENLTVWIEQNKEILGIDTTKLGFFSTSENGCTTGLETIVQESRHYSGPKPAFAIFYYGILPLRSSKKIHLDVPILTVTTKDYMYREIPESMDKFNRRAVADGAMITALDYPEGSYWFDCKEDSARSREILQVTMDFMSEYLSVEPR